ncbi:hypothetical protein BCR44DRAFT_90273 [Catenaria anguillulae PL171]|uniref:At4g15545-like C-terminal domain-containing protein n=1 Tax=Catenaria anguillulae PL171 TaxID=765915 RepID=A0A1Y2H7C1_9FUNG|nr:hypothetical protein BCR44DRAFT_90273 [Catenaria anguillulae PL171]
MATMASSAVSQQSNDMHYQQQQLPSPGAATAASSASTNPPDSADGANPPGPAFSDSAFTAQIRTGLDMIHSAVDSRVATLERELNHWRSLALTHQTQVQTLSAEAHRLKSSLSESEQRAQALSAENAHLRATKQALAQKYTTLKKTAAQLESWRRTIIRMVEYTPSVATASASFMNPSSSDDPTSHVSSLSMLDTAAAPGTVTSTTVTGAKKSSTKSGRAQPTSTQSRNPAPASSHPLVQRLTSAPTVSNSTAGSTVGRSFVAGADMDLSLGGGASGLPSFAEGGASVSGVGSVGLGGGHSSVGGVSDAEEDQGLERGGASAVGLESSAMMDQSNTTATPANPHHRHSSHHTQPHQQPSRSSKDRSSASKPSAATTAANTTANTTANTSTVADAQALYRAIRGTLSAESFTKFAHTINAFNANTIGVEETVARVEAIVTDRQLFMQMRNLIYKAMAESSFARSTASTAQAGTGGVGNSTMGGGTAANGANSTVNAGNGSRAGR